MNTNYRAFQDVCDSREGKRACSKAGPHLQLLQQDTRADGPRGLLLGSPRHQMVGCKLGLAAPQPRSGLSGSLGGFMQRARG